MNTVTTKSLSFWNRACLSIVRNWLLRATLLGGLLSTMAQAEEVPGEQTLEVPLTTGQGLSGSVNFEPALDPPRPGATDLTDSFDEQRRGELGGWQTIPPAQPSDPSPGAERSLDGNPQTSLI